MYTSEVVLKTALETGESGEISRNHWEIGEFGGLSGEIGGKAEFPDGEINIREKGGKMIQNCPIWGIRVEQFGEIKGK